ncbi:acyl-CoA dehydrogenase family protein [Paeniglutamicibacter sp. Y32M11]|uniref:acyl-CoA dehydrogenase family protein n=1 Tax=Paeniglutamicibacter sp. Y32M11 TaxID=2853258 RepID=UPI001C52DE55|nr:acyl-CoA dehydrogenase family protein [Paeniglutamicibacter sp. Y32M11]QXQ10282.1 hydroxylase [Paeniglutamicibacter sp. Y32M11]
MTTTTVSDVLTTRADELRSLASVNEELGKLSDETVQILRESGVMKLLAPVEYGGTRAHPVEFAETVMKIASLDGSAGWVAGVVGVHPWELELMSPKLQEEIWGEDEDTWVSSPYAPMGTASPVEGGYRFTGHWQFSTGTDHSEWVILGAFLGDSEGKPVQPPRFLHVVVPRKDYTIVEDSWEVVGLKGTGSKDVIIDDVFVPEYRAIDQAELFAGETARKAGKTEPIHRLPFYSIFPVGLTAAVIGIAEGALQAHLDYQRERVQINGFKSVEDPYTMYAVSEAAGEISASRDTLLASISRLYDTVAAGGEISLEQRAVARRTQIQAAWRATNAIDAILSRSGGNGLRLHNPVQRFWRDAHMGLAHAIHVPGPSYHAAIMTEVGVEPPANLAAAV